MPLEHENLRSLKPLCFNVQIPLHRIFSLSVYCIILFLSNDRPKARMVGRARYLQRRPVSVGIIVHSIDVWNVVAHT